MSKNAIVGKLHRMGWNAKATDSVPESITKKPVAKKGTPKAETKNTTRTTSAPKAKPGRTRTTTVVAAKAAKKSDAPAPVKATKKTGGGHAIATKGTAVHQRIVRHALEMANLKPNQCRWPIGDPDSEGFHFCGQTVFVGKPYCYEHCKQAYQFVPPKKK